MGAQATICQAMRETRLLQFYYDGGTRVVEPHQLAYNQRDKKQELGSGISKCVPSEG